MTYASDKRVFLLTFNGLRQPITNYLDTRPEILNWFGILPNAILIVSRSDATALTGAVHTRFPQMWFVIMEVDRYKANGFITMKTWDFINEPSSSGRWE